MFFFFLTDFALCCVIVLFVCHCCTLRAVVVHTTNTLTKAATNFACACLFSRWHMTNSFRLRGSIGLFVLVFAFLGYLLSMLLLLLLLLVIAIVFLRCYRCLFFLVVCYIVCCLSVLLFGITGVG